MDRPSRTEVPRPTFSSACDALEDVLSGGRREEILDRILGAGDWSEALRRLRTAMRSHAFPTASGTVVLDRIVLALDARTREDGFHVLQEWNHAAHRFIEHDIAVLMLDHFVPKVAPTGAERRVLSVLLDYYLLYVVALVVLRVWDESDPNENLDRVTGMLGALRGPGGSGQRLVDDAETLLFVAVSKYEPDGLAYHRLLEKVKTLDEPHRLRISLIGAPLLGSHLRWGLPALYQQDLGRMREDNSVDYPWLFFTVSTLARVYDRLHAAGALENERAEVAEALLNGLTPDPWAFVGEPPASIGDARAEHAEVRALLARHRVDLLKAFEAFAPTAIGYSPISFHVNFPHNVLIATVVLALGGTSAPNLPLDALLRPGVQGDASDRMRETLGRQLTAYAASNPERRGQRRVMMIAYDPLVGLRSFTRTVGALRDASPAGQLK